MRQLKFLKLSFILVCSYIIIVKLYNKPLNAQNNNVIVKGKLTNSNKNDKLFLYEIDLQNIIPLDSFSMKKNGKFSFCLTADETLLLLLRTNNNIMIKLAANPREIINIKGDFNDLLMTYSIDGSIDSELIRQIDRQIFAANRKIQSGLNFLSQQKTDDVEKIKDSLNSIFAQIFDDTKYFLKTLIHENEGSFASLIAINQILMNKMIITYENDLQTYLNLNNSLIEKYAKNKHLELFNKNLNDYLKIKTENDAIEKRAGIGVKANDINLFDPDSNKISLFDLKGKVILLHFWNPSCDLCREENKKLRELYFNHKNKNFEVFAVSIGTIWNDWIYAMNEDNINIWKNVKIPEEGTNIPNLYSYYLTLYGVKSVPYSFLIDKNGTIINKGFKLDTLDELLQDILK